MSASFKVHLHSEPCTWPALPAAACACSSCASLGLCAHSSSLQAHGSEQWAQSPQLSCKAQECANRTYCRPWHHSMCSRRCSHHSVRCRGTQRLRGRYASSISIQDVCMHDQPVMGDIPVCWEGAVPSHQHHIRQCITEAVLAEVDGWDQGAAGRCGSCSSLC